MNQANLRTLLFLRRGDEILLAMKKRGFGADRYNGVGGKLDSGETIEQALVRECQEEISVTPLSFEKVAVHDFVFPDGMPQMQVHTYISYEWEGDPIETEEMAPEWFALKDIPYDKMWQDDIFWLPAMLLGKKLTTRFVFNEDEQMLECECLLLDPAKAL